MTLCYVRWRDAVSEEADHSGTEAVARLCELEEIGWLLDENEEALLIGMENDQQGVVRPGRWRLHIPKMMIVERKDVQLDKAFPPKKRRRSTNASR